MTGGSAGGISLHDKNSFVNEQSHGADAGYGQPTKGDYSLHSKGWKTYGTEGQGVKEKGLKEKGSMDC